VTERSEQPDRHRSGNPPNLHNPFEAYCHSHGDANQSVFFEDFCSAKKTKIYYSSDLLDSGGWVPRSLQVPQFTISGAQADSKARILGMTMTVRVDIFTKLSR